MKLRKKLIDMCKPQLIQKRHVDNIAMSYY